MKRNQRNETVDEFLLTSSAVIVASYASVRRTVCDQRIVRGGDSQFAKLRMSTARRNQRNETVDEFLLTSSAVTVASYASVRRTICDRVLCGAGTRNLQSSI